MSVYKDPAVVEVMQEFLTTDEYRRLLESQLTVLEEENAAILQDDPLRTIERRQELAAELIRLQTMLEIIDSATPITPETEL